MSDVKPIAIKPARKHKRKFTMGVNVKRILKDMDGNLHLTGQARDILLDLIQQVVQDQSHHAAALTRHANRKVMQPSDIKGAVALMFQFQPALAARINKRARDALNAYKETVEAKKKAEAAKKPEEKPAENGKEA